MAPGRIFTDAINAVIGTGAVYQSDLELSCRSEGV
jgi:hypothetical protein